MSCFRYTYTHLFSRFNYCKANKALFSKNVACHMGERKQRLINCFITLRLISWIFSSCLGLAQKIESWFKWRPHLNWQMEAWDGNVFGSGKGSRKWHQFHKKWTPSRKWFKKTIPIPMIYVVVISLTKNVPKLSSILYFKAKSNELFQIHAHTFISRFNYCVD